MLSDPVSNHPSMQHSQAAYGREPLAVRLVLIVGVILACLVASLLLLETRSLTIFDRSEANYFARKYNEAARMDVQANCGLLARPERAVCVRRMIQSAREQQRQEYNLEAQRKAANWNAAMGEASILGMLISVVGVAFVFGTLSETRRTARAAIASVNQAARAADAAERTLQATREVAAADLRPWVVIEPRLTRVKIDDLGFDFRYDVVFRNIGKTAAARLYVDMGGGFLRGDDLTEEVESMYAEWERAERYTGDRTLLPGEEYVAFSASSHVSRFIRWDEWSDETRRSMYVLAASANYWSALGSSWHRTERSFTIGERHGDGFVDHQHLRDTLRGEWRVDEAAEHFAISQWRAGATT